MNEFIETTAYITMEASRYAYGRVNEVTGLKPATGVKALRITQGRPARLERDQIAVKIKLRLPAAIFDPLTPRVVITIPEDMVLRGDIEIEAVEAE